MKRNILKNRRGATLVETMVSVSLLSMILLGTLGLLISMLNIWAKGSSGTTANQSASLALNRMIMEIEEGKSASVQSGKLVVVFPFYDTATDDYNRGTNGKTITYYLSGNTGNESTGNYLWRAVSGGAKTRLAKHIDQANFAVTSSRVVQMQLRGVDREGGCISPKTVRITIKLRNS